MKPSKRLLTLRHRRKFMTWSNSITLSPSQGDRFLLWGLRGLAGFAGTIILLIILFLVIESFPVFNHVGISHFFTDSSWHPTEGLYNLVPMVWGTLFATTGAVIIATILGITSALFCHYYAPVPLATLYRKFIELLAGVPSVVYGLWGLVVLVPFIASFHPPGPSLLAGITILTLMILSHDRLGCRCDVDPSSSGIHSRCHRARTQTMVNYLQGHSASRQTRAFHRCDLTNRSSDRRNHGYFDGVVAMWSKRPRACLSQFGR